MMACPRCADLVRRNRSNRCPGCGAGLLLEGVGANVPRRQVRCGYCGEKTTSKRGLCRAHSDLPLDALGELDLDSPAMQATSNREAAQPTKGKGA